VGDARNEEVKECDEMLTRDEMEVTWKAFGLPVRQMIRVEGTPAAEPFPLVVPGLECVNDNGNIDLGLAQIE